MQVVDTLPGLGAVIEDQSVAIAGDLAVIGDPIGDADQTGHDGVMLRRQVRQRGDVLFRDHQDVRGRDRSDVLEGHRIRIAEDLVGRDQPRENLAEEALFGHGGSLA